MTRFFVRKIEMSFSYGKHILFSVSTKSTIKLRLNCLFSIGTRDQKFCIESEITPRLKSDAFKNNSDHFTSNYLHSMQKNKF